MPEYSQPWEYRSREERTGRSAQNEDRAKEQAWVELTLQVAAAIPFELAPAYLERTVRAYLEAGLTLSEESRAALSRGIEEG